MSLLGFNNIYLDWTNIIMNEMNNHPENQLNNEIISD